MRQDGVFNDEAEHAAERRKTQEQRVSGQPWMYVTAGAARGHDKYRRTFDYQEREDFEWAMKMMNKDKIAAMKEQEILKAKMQAAYKVRNGGRQGG